MDTTLKTILLATSFLAVAGLAACSSGPGPGFESRRFATLNEASAAIAQHFDCELVDGVSAVERSAPTLDAFLESYGGQDMQLFAELDDGRRVYVSSDGTRALNALQTPTGVTGGYSAGCLP